MLSTERLIFSMSAIGSPPEPRSPPFFAGMTGKPASVETVIGAAPFILPSIVIVAPFPRSDRAISAYAPSKIGMSASRAV